MWFQQSDDRDNRKRAEPDSDAENMESDEESKSDRPIKRPKPNSDASKQNGHGVWVR